MNIFSNKPDLIFKSLIIWVVLISGCSTTQVVQDQDENKASAEESIAELYESSAVFSGNFTGFALYDPETDSMIYAQNESKYFTPASNTKLFSFYAGLKLLPDSLPALEYIVKGDSLIFWGTGYPAFLHPDFEDTTTFNFLKNSPQELYFSDSNFRDEVLGPGWAWGDYQYYYSTERSPFPIYGNVVRFEIEEIELRRIRTNADGLQVIPKAFQERIETVEDTGAEPFLFRPFFDNRFEYKAEGDTITYFMDRPFHYTPELITELLSDTLGRDVEYIKMAKPKGTGKLYGIAADTVYKRMLQPSDNFLAEQILFMAAAEMGKPINSRAAINVMKDEHLNDLSDEPEWADGSGLSRYNMFTPLSIIQLLQKINEEFENDHKLFDMLPNGGRSGTIRSWYGHREGGEPYVFAKTGTLNHNHSLSGFIMTRSGKKLIFSFQNNHYTSPSSVVKEEMEKVLWFIYENY